MTWIAPQPERRYAPPAADERTMLQGWLDYQRDTLLGKCAGLTTEQLRQRSVPPSSMSLLGLVRHLTEVERSWFRRRMVGESVDWVYCTDASEDGDFDDVDTADPAVDLPRFLDEAAACDAAVADRALDETFFHAGEQQDMSLRWIYVHLIEEYARHNGHADLLRERIDGATGE